MNIKASNVMLDGILWFEYQILAIEMMTFINSLESY